MNLTKKLKIEFGIALTPHSELHSPEFGIALTEKVV